MAKAPQTRTPQLLDHRGNPIERTALATLQGEPGLISVRQAWTQTVASGLTPARLAAILHACDQGEMTAYLALAEEMEERDPHYASVLGTRKRAVSGVKPVVEAASEEAADEKLAQAVRDAITSYTGFSELVTDLLDGLGKGFSAVEIDWDTTGTPWRPAAFKHRNAQWFRFDRATGEELRLIDEADPVDGVALKPFGWLVHRPKLKSGLTARSGLARLVAFSWMCKAYTLKDWMAFVAGALWPRGHQDRCPGTVHGGVQHRHGRCRRPAAPYGDRVRSRADRHRRGDLRKARPLCR
jgi:phage gp29-like protein